jgi:hypothetical protein
MKSKAEILKDSKCKDCGWPVISAFCNDQWNRRVYCSNKGCKNHDDEGILYHKPKWIVGSEEEWRRQIEKDLFYWKCPKCSYKILNPEYQSARCNYDCAGCIKSRLEPYNKLSDYKVVMGKL